jgi:2'-5' RNA ligase superfamily protein
VVHSVELLFDPDTESAIRGVWQALSDAGLHSPAQTSRPHVTMVVADEVGSDVDELLGPVVARLPIPCMVGAPMLFGRSTFVLVRLVVPSTELLSLQAEVLRVCTPYLTPGPAPNTLVGQWTPHVTLARRVDPSQLKRAFGIRRLGREIQGTVVGLRRWDGNDRVEYVIS